MSDVEIEILKATVEEQKNHIIKQKDDFAKAIAKKDDEISELNSTLKVKTRIQKVVNAEYTSEYFPRLIIGIINLFDPSKKSADLYLSFMAVINYALVCSIGVLINMVVIHQLIKFLPLYLANFGAILIAWLSNYTFTVGPYGYLFGLSPRMEDRTR